MPRILVVEDDKDWQDILRDFFLCEEDCYYEVVIARDHSEAIKELEKAKSQEKPFHLVTVDMELSSIGKVAGRRVVDYLKKHGTPCVVVSGSVQETTEVRDLFKEYAVCDYIEKGERFDFELFRKMVKKALAAKTQEEKAMLPEQRLSQAEDIGSDELVDISLGKLKELLQIRRGNLEELETRKAKYGMSPPLSLINEIDHEKDQIHLIEEELTRRGKPAISRNITDL